MIAGGVSRVVAAQRDPFPAVSGGGLAALEKAGIAVEVGLLEDEAKRLSAPYLKLVQTGRPWIIAKWAMTLDGKLATRTGDSRWISSEASRAIVHQLRGRVDAIVVGSRTAAIDDPLLTARPPGPRTATRIVVDSLATLSSGSQLVKIARETPVLVAAGPAATETHRDRLADAGCKVLACAARRTVNDCTRCMTELGRRQMTNVLVEGGAGLLGVFFDEGLIDEVHVFVAPKLVGGADAPSPLGGRGRDLLRGALVLPEPEVQVLGGDLYVQARLARADSPIVRSPADA